MYMKSSPLPLTLRNQNLDLNGHRLGANKVATSFDKTAKLGLVERGACALTSVVLTGWTKRINWWSWGITWLPSVTVFLVVLHTTTLFSRRQQLFRWHCLRMFKARSIKKAMRQDAQDSKNRTRTSTARDDPRSRELLLIGFYCWQKYCASRHTFLQSLKNAEEFGYVLKDHPTSVKRARR